MGSLQMLIMATWAGLVQRFSLNIEDYPEVMTGGFLWFKDLTLSDPYFILPLVNALLIFLNMSVNLQLNLVQPWFSWFQRDDKDEEVLRGLPIVDFPFLLHA